MASEAPAPEIVRSPQPRALTAREQVILAGLLASPVATPELHRQAEAVLVTGECSCGCPSISLSVPEGLPRASWPLGTVGVRHGADADIVAEATAPDGFALDVILHISGGELVELEVWAGSFGGDPRTDLPDPSTLRLVD
jgi:hypothetical protein